MDHVTPAVRRLLARPRFVPAYLAACLALGGALVLIDAWPTTLTDEDDYVPYGFGDLLEGRNPYTTGRNVDREIDPTCTWHDMGRCWYSLPYLPLTLLLQIPFLDYRWTSLLAFGLLTWSVRDRPLAFLGLANPLVLWLAAAGFTDLVVVALLAWSRRLRTPWLAWLAAATKQFALPILLAFHAWRREWRQASLAAGFTLLVCLPFLLWDPAAFIYWTTTVHLSGSDHKLWGLLGIGHPNYLLYYLFIATILLPEAPPQRTSQVDPATNLGAD